MNRDEHRRWSDGISNILVGFTADTDRSLVAWAMGAHQESHALSVCQLLNGTFTASAGGSTLTVPGVRYLDYNSREVVIKSLGDHNTALITVTWREIAAALRVDSGLHAEMKAALAERREITGRQMDGPWRNLMNCPPEHMAERDALSEAWAAIERRCYDLGAAAWEGCRPPDKPEPADLLELLNAMASA